jgi:hypothetical protein
MKVHKKPKKIPPPSEPQKPARFNVILPGHIADRLAKETNKSAYVAKALVEKWTREEKAKFSEELAQAYRDSAKENRHLDEELDGASGDGV